MFSLAAAAQFLARPGEYLPAVEHRIRNFLDQRLVHFDSHADNGNRTRLMRVEDVAVAEILNTVTHAKMRGYNAEISVASYCWEPGINDRPATIRKGVSPIQAALVGCNAGDIWGLRMSLFYDEATGRHKTFTGLYNLDVAPINLAGTLAPSFTEEADIVLPLTRIMLRFADFLAGATLA